MVSLGLENVNLTCSRLPDDPDWRAVPRQPVGNASQLLAALAAQAAAGQGVGVLEVTTDIVLDEASIAGAALPFSVSAGRTLALVGGELPAPTRGPGCCLQQATGPSADALRCAPCPHAAPPTNDAVPAAASQSVGSIDVAAVSRFLVLEPGSVVILANLSMSGEGFFLPSRELSVWQSCKPLPAEARHAPLH